MRLLVLFLVLALPLKAVSSTFDELERKLRNIRSVKVVFLQKTRYSWYPKPETSKGIFYATRNGKEILILNEEDREALLDSVENNTSPVVESLFFFARPLSEVFEPVGELEKEGVRVLVLKPVQKDENVKEVYVELDEDLEVLRVRVLDSEDTETTVELARYSSGR